MAKSRAKSKKTSRKDLPPAYDWLKPIQQTDQSIYLLHGEEAMFSHQAAEWLVNRALGTGIADFNLDRFDASESQFSVAALLNALDTQPMMNDKRVVWLQATELLNKQAKSQIETLIKYLESPNPTTCFILEARTRLDQTRSLAKALDKSPQVYSREAAVMTAQQTEKWLTIRTKTLGLQTTQEVLSLIQESGDGRLGEMDDTLNKLALFIEPRTEITLEDVTTLLPEAKLQTTVWTLLDKLALCETAEVIALSHSLLAQGQEVMGLMALVHKRLKELLAARCVMQQGGGEAMLAQTLKINGYAAKRIIQLAQNRSSLSIMQIAKGYRTLAWADRGLKGAKIDQKTLLEYVLVELCQAT